MMTDFDFDLENVVKKRKNLSLMTYTIDSNSVSVAISAFSRNYVTSAICSVQNDVLVLFMNRDLVLFPEMRIVERNVQRIWRMPRPDVIFVQTDCVSSTDKVATYEFEGKLICSCGSEFSF
jgi:hypothetical protein